MPKETVARVIDSVDIKDVVEKVLGIEMKREGGGAWKCKCPFHEEKTPSFVVYSGGSGGKNGRGSQRFKCMGGCAEGGRGGDALEFVMKKEGLGFREALERLAQIGGVQLPPKPQPGATAKDPISRARGAAEWAAKYWEGRLWGSDGAAALTYLRERGLTDETLKRFRVGLVADAWRDLNPRLERAGYTKAEMADAGVAAPGQKGGFYDRFKGRIVCPIQTPYGAVIGFGARVMPGAEGAKYINGPETPLYKKSSALFGIHFARDAIRRDGRAVVSEGYMDAMALHQAGVGGSVAACGTALTAEHLSALRGVGAKSVTLIFDGDEAGLRAVSTRAPLVLASGLSGFVALMPNGLDPDDLAKQQGASALRAVVDEAIPLSQFLVDRAVAARCGADVEAAPLEAKTAVLADLGACLAAADPLAKALLETQIAARLGLPLSSLRREPDAKFAAGLTAEAQALLADLAEVVLPGGGGPLEAQFRALVERAQTLTGITPVAEKGPAASRLLVVENSADGKAYLEQHPALAAETEVMVLAGNPAGVRDAVERLRGAGPIVVLSAFSNTLEGSKLAGLVEHQVQGLEGVVAERAAPARANHGWAGPTETARAKGLAR
jgi:DNA primase